MWGLPAPLPASHNHHGPVMILAFFNHLQFAHALFVCDDGRIRNDQIIHLTTEWRFNWQTHTWEDTDIGDQDDEGSDGRTEVPGDVPEPDGANGSDSRDEGHGAIGGLVPE